MDKEENIGNENVVFGGGRVQWADFNTYTCVGGRSENQDSLAFHTMSHGGYQVFVVCDGMGGHAGGCMASSTAAVTLIDALERQPKDIAIAEAITEAVNHANHAVYTMAQEEPSLRGMGTTLTLLAIDGEAAYVTHVGDSRIYQFRKSRKVFRTTDHSMVFEQVSKGALTEEEARVHPRGNILARAMGVLPDVDFKVIKLPYRKNDRFVLCSDGIWNSRPEAEIIEMLTGTENLEEMVRSTYETVERLGAEKSGDHDNHTMIAVDMLTDSRYQKTLCSRIKRLFSK